MAEHKLNEQWVEELDENDERIYAVEHECNIDMTTGWDHDKQTVINAWNRRA